MDKKVKKQRYYPFINRKVGGFHLFLGIAVFLFVLAENVGAELPMSLEDIISDRGQWQVDATVLSLIDQKREVNVGSETIIEISPDVFINIPGVITTNEQEQRQIAAIWGVRYGLTSRLEVLSRIAGFSSWIDRLGTDGQSSDSDINFSDLWLGMNYQTKKEGDGHGVLFTVESAIAERNSIAYSGKILNGYSGLKTFLLGTTIYRQFDPVVISGSIGYRFGFERDVENITYQPGSVVIWNLITTFAANEIISLSGGMSGAAQFSSKVNGAKLGQTRNDISLLGGVSFAISKTRSITVLAQGGLTDTAPDAMISVKAGWRFK